jgi:hypothetical protein
VTTAVLAAVRNRPRYLHATRGGSAPAEINRARIDLNGRHLPGAAWLLMGIALAVSAARAASAMPAPPQLPKLGPFDLKVESVPVSAAVQLLRDRECSPVSFIDVSHSAPISLDLHRVMAAEVLQRIAKSNPAFRAETIDSRDVLYPAGAAFQRIVDGIDIQSMPRLDAADRYLERLHQEPAFAHLVSQVILGDPRHPIFTAKVSLRAKGRVIDHLVDLLGEDPALYFEFTRAMSGVPELRFLRISCGESR